MVCFGAAASLNLLAQLVVAAFFPVLLLAGLSAVTGAAAAAFLGTGTISGQWGSAARAGCEEHPFFKLTIRAGSASIGEEPNPHAVHLRPPDAAPRRNYGAYVSGRRNVCMFGTTNPSEFRTERVALGRASGCPGTAAHE